MINPFEQVNWKPTKKDIRSFGKTIAIGFIVVSIILWLVGTLTVMSAITVACGGLAACTISYAIPALAKPLYFVWFFCAACIGIVISNVLLTIFYYLFFTPFVLIVRLLTGRDPLQLKDIEGSMWSDCEKEKDLKRYLKQY